MCGGCRYLSIEHIVPESSKLLSLYTPLPHTAVIERLNRLVLLDVLPAGGGEPYSYIFALRHLADIPQIETYGPASLMMMQGLP
jgi:hypothetical protein